jgi:hypothetical protein
MMKKLSLILFLSLLCSSLLIKQLTLGASEGYGEPFQIGTITSPSVAEISGITPSRTARGLWWIHNDSGDQARLYFINSSGKLLGRYTVTGARHRDWEDMAGVTGEDGQPMLYIGDFGNNSLRRDDLTIYRVKEPDLSTSIGDGVTEEAESLPFRYPDGNHNAEALFIDHQSGRPYIVTKTFSPPCGVYRFPMPLRPKVRVTLEKMEGRAVEQISKLFLVTGAATSSDGNRVIVRTYFGALEMVRSKGGPFETIFKSVPATIKLPRERQGEAISYAPDGKSLVTTSEKIPAPIFKIDRK